jgi:hypothetical protein
MGALRSRLEAFLQLAWALSLFAVMLMVRVDGKLAIATGVTTSVVLILLAIAITEGRRRIDRMVADPQRTADFDLLTGLLTGSGPETHPTADNRHGVQSRIPRPPARTSTKRAGRSSRPKGPGDLFQQSLAMPG